MKSTYTDGVQRVEVKNKYAYHYNKAGSCIGRSRFDHRREFIDRLYAIGFKRNEQELIVMERKQYKLTDESGEIYDVRTMDSIDLERAQFVALESTDGVRSWVPMEKTR